MWAFVDPFEYWMNCIFWFWIMADVSSHQHEWQHAQQFLWVRFLEVDRRQINLPLLMEREWNGLQLCRTFIQSALQFVSVLGHVQTELSPAWKNKVLSFIWMEPLTQRSRDANTGTEPKTTAKKSWSSFNFCYYTMWHHPAVCCIDKSDLQWITL